MNAGAVRVAIHRLRDRLRKAVVDEVRVTVQDEASIDDAIRYLMEVVSSTQ